MSRKPVLMLLTIISCWSCGVHVRAQPDYETALVGNTIAQARHKWPDNDSVLFPAAMMRIMDTLAVLGVVDRSGIPVDLPAAAQFDKALNAIRRLHAGVRPRSYFRYDGVVPAGTGDDAGITTPTPSAMTLDTLSAWLRAAEPSWSIYRAMRAQLMRLAYADSLPEDQRMLQNDMALLRYVRAMTPDSFVLINIPSATLSYILHDSVRFRMRVIVGAPEHRTPRFTAYIRQVTLYPYWNMPRSILVQEWLPAFRKNPSLISSLEMELLDKNGRKIDPKAINWAALTNEAFPYRIRQKTGCRNPLGVVKFSTDAPFDVYLHDTNFKGAFRSSYRFRSHGCIRVEDPIRLANALLPAPVDTGYLQSCFNDQQPEVMNLRSPVPVYVIYSLFDCDTDSVLLKHKDPYHLTPTRR